MTSTALAASGLALSLLAVSALAGGWWACLLAGAVLIALAYVNR